MSRFVARTISPSFRQLLVCCLLVVSAAVSVHAWAVNTDKDALPDAWETANGHDPLIADYAVSVSGSTVSVCTSGNCSVATQSFPVYGSALTGTTCKVGTISVGYDITRKNGIECSIASATSLSCRAVHQVSIGSANGSSSTLCPGTNPAYFYSSWQTVNTATDIGHFSVSTNKLCALTTGGVQCWNVAISAVKAPVSAYQVTVTLSLTDQGLQSYPIDPEGDGFNSNEETALGNNPLNALDPPLAAISTFYIWGLDNHTTGASAFNTVWSNANGVQDSISSCDTCTAAGTAITTTANGDGCTVSSNGVQCLWWGMDNGPVYWEEFLPLQVGGQTYNPIHDWDGYLKYVDGSSNLHNVATDASRISSDHHNHACIVSKTLGVYCWASHSGTDIVSSNIPAALQNVSTVKDVAVGANHACAINNTTVQCWGDASSGKTTVLGAVNSPTQLAAGTDHTCAINADRTVSCWGDNTNGELGDVDMDGLVDGVSNALKISAGSHHTCAVTGSYATPSSLRVTCWGKNNMGQTSVPTDLTNGVEKPVNITAANDETCAIRAGQNVAATAMICWPVGLAP